MVEEAVEVVTPEADMKMAVEEWVENYILLNPIREKIYNKIFIINNRR
jgi:uncharacterized protein YrzB (UPF0473 family)